jgi:phospho-N-acetylmuramoyl-pentapeptide-transferase
MLSIWLMQLTGIDFLGGRMFRAGGAALLSIFLVMTTMPFYIRYLQSLDATSDFDSGGQKSPPIMGGLLLVVIVILSSLAFSALNSFVISTLVILVAYSTVGAIDDIAKIRNKRLVALGKLTQKDYQEKADGLSSTLRLTLYFLFSIGVAAFAYKFIPGLTGHLTIPFINPQVWNPYLPNWAFILFMSFVITATANGTNFTDGLDSLVSIPIITSMIFVGLVAYFSGNFIFSEYLHINFQPGVDELFPVATAIVGALLAYLWFNSPPAEIYMGDAGSIGFGGAIGIMFILVRAELFIPIICFIIIAEALSVVIQIGYFKMTRKRVFLCAPIHHHFQFKWKDRFSSKPLLNSKIVWRMHLISVFMLIIGLVIFFKIR